MQAGPEVLPALRRFEEVPSATPWVEVEGVRVVVIRDTEMG